MDYPRAAFLPDTFHEVNGVAHTSRQFEAFARRRGIPLLSVHTGGRTERSEEGPITVVQLKRGPGEDRARMRTWITILSISVCEPGKGRRWSGLALT